VLGRAVAGAENAHPADLAALGVVVGLLLDQVAEPVAGHLEPVGHVLAAAHLAGGDIQPGDGGPGAEPHAEHDLLGDLPRADGLPVPPGRQRLEVDPVGQCGGQAGRVLGGHGPGETLPCAHHGGYTSTGTS
jgi:hypothetical protein